MINTHYLKKKDGTKVPSFLSNRSKFAMRLSVFRGNVTTSVPCQPGNRSKFTVRLSVFRGNVTTSVPCQPRKKRRDLHVPPHKYSSFPLLFLFHVLVVRVTLLSIVRTYRKELLRILRERPPQRAVPRLAIEELLISHAWRLGIKS